MRREIMSGLVALTLLGGCGGKVPTTPKRDSTISRNRSGERKPVRTSFVSDFGYTTNVDPRDYGLVRQKNSRDLTIRGQRLFSETFSDGKNYAILVTKQPPLGPNLQTNFVQLLAIHNQMFQQTLAPGQGLRIMGEGLPKPTTIDGMKGVSGGVQLWKFKNEREMLKDKYIQKIDIRIDLAQESKNLYTFTMFSNNVTGKEHSRISGMYHKFVDSFKR